jgi:hypothetical protein
MTITVADLVPGAFLVNVNNDILVILGPSSKKENHLKALLVDNLGVEVSRFEISHLVEALNTSEMRLVDLEEGENDMQEVSETEKV